MRQKRLVTCGRWNCELAKGLIHKLKVAQRTMERAMLGISLKDKIRNEEIRQRIKATYIALKLAMQCKWHWADHLCRRTEYALSDVETASWQT